MLTHAPQVIPTSPSSHTRALWPADPAPLHWPALPAPLAAQAIERSRALHRQRMATMPACAELVAAVAECVALCPEVST